MASRSNWATNEVWTRGACGNPGNPTETRPGTADDQFGASGTQQADPLAHGEALTLDARPQCSQCDARFTPLRPWPQAGRLLAFTIEVMTRKIAYTFDEAAEQSGCSVRTLQQAVSDGKLSARYANATEVIRHEDLATWVDHLPTMPNIGTDATVGDSRPESPRPVETPRPPRPEPEREWLTPDDLSTIWQLSTGTLANWRTNKKGPAFVRIGGIVRHRRDDVDSWLKAQPSE